ncbi:cation transporter [Vibrio sp. SCSIO 43140]|uniref:cation transporter n=1 Tax=Vibrio sp. SCSIO 43140 TaxID=2819100 RepID=UPI0020758B2F|nr:cation transporter [Vibrio sp. SCSIO 43140]USD62810.1 cation transporter [Vibrio sp. SCSIO 43140]
MSSQKQHNESSVLRVSAIIATGFAVAGLVVGVLMGSLVIAFDGVYSLVSLLLTLLSLAAAHQLKKPKSHAAKYGRQTVESVVIAIKGFVILVIVLASLYSAISSMFTGGRPVDTTVATIFGLFNVLGCSYAWWYISKQNKVLCANLIEAETKQWQMDTLLSFAVMAGFITAWGLEQSPWSHLSVYADPVMMILISAYFIKVPAFMLIDACKSLSQADDVNYARNS